MKKFSKEFWEAVRIDFEQKMPLPKIRAKYELSRGALHNRIKRHDWENTKLKPKPKIKTIKKKKEDIKEEKHTIADHVDLSGQHRDLVTVKTLLFAGKENKEIAEVLGMSLRAFENKYEEEVKTMLAVADAQVAHSVFKMATDKHKPSVQAQKLWFEIQEKRKKGEVPDTIETNPFISFEAPTK